MSRYIDVDLAIDEIIKDMCGIPDVDEGIHTAISELRLMPTENVRENVKGEWTDHRTLEHDGEFYCSNCGFVLDSYIQGAFYNYCPNCGADMRGAV